MRSDDLFEWGAHACLKPHSTIASVVIGNRGSTFNVQVAQKSGFASFDPGQDLHRYTAKHLTAILESIDLLIANHHNMRECARSLE
jgi:ribokinase